MKTLLLSITGFLLFTSLAYGQCTPDMQYEDEAFGVWPDTTQGFPDAQVGVYYEQVVTIKIPSSGGPIDPQYESFPVDSASLSGIVNIPPGLELVCNSQTTGPCTYLPEQIGCAVVQGTPTSAGSFDVTINATIYSLLLGSVVPFPMAFDGYSIEVDGSSGQNEMKGNGFALKQNYPNPAGSTTNLYFTLPSPSQVRIEVFDLVGKEVFSEVMRGKQGNNSYSLDVSGLEAGIYLYSVESMGIKSTRRLAVDR